MHPGSGFLGQHHIPHHLQFLGDGGAAGEAQLAGDFTLVNGVVAHHVPIFAVVQNGQTQGAGLLHGLAQQGQVLDGDAVVGEGGYARFPKSLEVGEGFALLTLGDSTSGIDVNTRVGGLLLH